MLPELDVGGQCTPRNRPRLLAARDERWELADIVKALEIPVTGLGLHQNGDALHLAQREREGDRPKVRATSTKPPELECADGIPRGIADDLILDDLVAVIDASSRADLHAKRWRHVRW